MGHRKDTNGTGSITVPDAYGSMLALQTPALSWGRGGWEARGSWKVFWSLSWCSETLQACSLEPSEEEESVLLTMASSWRGTLSGSVIRFGLWHVAWWPFHRSLTCYDMTVVPPILKGILLVEQAARGQGAVFYPRGWGPEHNTRGRVVTGKYTSRCQA